MSREVRFLVAESIGPKRSVTPDGFLVCHDVPIARVGMQMYAPNELPLDDYDFTPAPDGIYRVHRTAEEVFALDAIVSCAGKPVVNEHPKDDVNPTNWRRLSMGHAMHPRQGEGLDDDVLIADLFITDADMIEEIADGKREVSCGYDVDYYELSPGVLEQRNIRINHIALVTKGRCGPRCAIADNAPEPPTEEITMAGKPSLKDRIVACFIKDDRASLSQVLDEVEKIETPPARTRDDDEHGMTHGGGVHLHLGRGGGDEGPPPWFKEHAESNDRRISDIEGTVGKLSEAFQAWANQEKGEPEHDAEEPEGPAGEKPPTEEIEGEIEEEAPEGSEERGKTPEGEDAGAVPPEFKEHQKEAADESEEEEEEEEEEKKPPPPKDRKRGKDRGKRGKDKARDSVMLEAAYQDTLALAEVLAPGIQGPAFDRKLPAERTLASMREFRCRSLDVAYLNPMTRPIIEGVIGKGRKLRVRDLKPADLRTVFRAVGVAVKEANKSRLRPTHDLLHPQPSAVPTTPIRTLADYQKMLNAHYAPKA